jgi:hypothetical protein
MLELLKLLLEPKVLSVIGPLGLIAIVEGVALYKMFKVVLDLQEKRLNEWKTIKDEYVQLSNDLNKTLDSVLRVIGKNGK